MKKNRVDTGGAYGILSQKSLSTFLLEKNTEKEIDKSIEGREDKIEEVEASGEGIDIENKIADSAIAIHREIEIEDQAIGKRRANNQIETDYYEQSRIATCVKKVKERFNVDVDVIPVRYGSKPPINQKIYGYYMLITVKGKGYDHIVEFIRNDCNLKVYSN